MRLHGARQTFLLAAVLACGLLAPATEAARKKPAPSQELAQLREKLDRLKREIESAEGDKADVLDQLKQSERAISDLNRGLHDLAAEQRETAAALTEAQRESAQLRGGIQSQQALLAKLLFQQYVYQSQDPLRLILSLEDPNEVSRQSVYYGYLSRSRASLIAGLKHDLENAEVAAALVREKHADLEDIRRQQQAEKTALQREANNRRGTLNRLDKQIGARRKQVTQLERDQHRLTQLVERLARVLPAKPRIPRRAATAPANYAALQGKLPVSGELSNRFGGPRPDTGTPWKGWFIRAGNGSPVKVPEAGRVVFADWLRGFGNLIIIDHGDGYLSLYGFNEALLKQEGDSVKPGDVVASVGNSGGNAESGLYFEVRYQSRPVDPASWLNR